MILNQIIFCISMGLLLGGCSLKKIDLNLPQYEVSSERRLSILNDYFHNPEEVRTFRGLALARNKIKSDLFKVRYVFLANSDGRLRIDSLPVNSGVVMTVLKSDGKRAVLLDNAPKIAYLATADDKLLDRALNVPLSPARLPALLAARIPRTQIAVEKSFIYETGNEVILFDKAENEIYRFDSAYRTLMRLTKLNQKNSEVIWELSWDYHDESKDKTPLSMTLSLPTKSYLGSFYWRVFEINPDLDSGHFEASIPNGWKKRDL
jgi:hypothetical protein